MILVSGGFDPVHTGHLDYLLAAGVYGKVIVALNSDEWLVRKKGYYFMCWDDRKRILESIRYVHKVVAVNDLDGTVCAALKSAAPRYFANGGDRETSNPKEHDMCKKLNITEMFGVGGGKTRSSSELIKGIK